MDWANDMNFKGRKKGYIYIPNQCQGEGSANCRLHFVLHGCDSSPAYLQNKGYENYAITNDFIVVWPDTRCWDMWGQISPGDTYKTNDGLVHKALNQMIERLTAEP